MSDIDSPAGTTGGPVPVPTVDDLPEKMRVHALARLLGRTSREVISALAEFGVEVRTAQSSIDRKAAEQVVTALLAPAGAVAEPAAPAAEPPSPPPSSPAPDVAEPLPGEPPEALVPLFAPPTPLFQPPVPPAAPARGRRRAAAEVEIEVPEPIAEDEPEEETAGPADVDDTEDGDSASRRRRRRGRRGRGRGRGGDDDAGPDGDEAGGPAASEEDSDGADDESDEAEEESDADESESDDAEDGGRSDDTAGSRRRRRRRRRRGNGEDADASEDSDPPNTVVRVRQPRERDGRDRDGGDAGDGVQSVRGSTRLEAKRQRRRDGRDAGRRRVPILSEAEFLARRESVDRTMVVRERGDRIEIGVLEDDILVEHFVAASGRDGGSGKSLVGNIYLGRVQNVLPSMEAAFVDIGRGRNAVLYAGEVDWDAAGLGGKARRIEQALNSGDSVLVQVTKDPIGHKGARLTTQISLAGRFLVYVPSGGAAGISRKLPDVERKRLKDMLKEIVPSEAGVIIRTASEGVSHEALERDVRRLQAQWEVVKTRSELTGPNRPKAPVLLYEEPDLLIKVVRDQFNEDFSRLVVEGDEAWDTLQNYVGHVASDLAPRLHRHVGTTDVFAAYRIDEQLLKALDRKVWLPSGGTLVIDRTEAMTVIDVNTGKFTGSGGNLEETVTRNNLEAAEEVVRQLRLRDIGGIIVVDFIDMVLEANRDLVLRRLTECLARDRTRHQVAEVTSLGLVQMTRKRVGGGLLEHFSTPCEHCRGRGVVVNAEPLVEPEPGRSADRAQPAERESGRRSRGRGRRDSGDGDTEREGRRESGRRNGSTRNGSPMDVATRTGLDTSVEDVSSGSAGSAVADAADSETRVPVDRGAAGLDVGAPLEAADTATAPAVPVPDVPAGVEPAVAGGTDVAADAVEEIVVERSLGEPRPAAAQPVDAHAVDVQPVDVQPDAPQPVDAQPSDAQSVDDQPATGGRNGSSRTPRARRGRVTRTAGAPDPTSGDTPVAVVVTVPAATGPDAGSEPAAAGSPPAVPPQPAPSPVTRPRRSRRAASRPAGPPAAESPDPGADAGGDPV